LGAKSFDHDERIAIVTDATWLRRTVTAFGWLIPGEVKVYPHDQLDVARDWVTELRLA
jgi:hypothetical protein